MSLSFYSINAQGLKNVKSKVNILKLISMFKPSILCVQETNIDPFIDSKITVPNYSSHYNPPTSKFSGTVIFCSASVTVLSSKNLVEGKLQALNIYHANGEYLIINIHMPHNIQT